MSPSSCQVCWLCSTRSAKAHRLRFVALALGLEDGLSWSCSESQASWYGTQDVIISSYILCAQWSCWIGTWRGGRSFWRWRRHGSTTTTATTAATRCTCLATLTSESSHLDMEFNDPWCGKRNPKNISGPKNMGRFLEFSCWPWRSFFFKEEIRTMGRDRILNSTQHGHFWTTQTLQLQNISLFSSNHIISHKILGIKQKTVIQGKTYIVDFVLNMFICLICDVLGNPDLDRSCNLKVWTGGFCVMAGVSFWWP